MTDPSFPMELPCGCVLGDPYENPNPSKGTGFFCGVNFYRSCRVVNSIRGDDACALVWGHVKAQHDSFDHTQGSGAHGASDLP